MSAYTRHDDVIHVDGYRYALTSPLEWRMGTIDGPKHQVPAGFVFDVSVPWFLHWIFNPHADRYFKAAALHDHMLSVGWDRLTAAAQFHLALTADGVPVWRRLPMFLATALFRYR